MKECDNCNNCKNEELISKEEAKLRALFRIGGLIQVPDFEIAIADVDDDKINFVNEINQDLLNNNFQFILNVRSIFTFTQNNFHQIKEIFFDFFPNKKILFTTGRLDLVKNTYFFKKKDIDIWYCLEGKHFIKNFHKSMTDNYYNFIMNGGGPIETRRKFLKKQCKGHYDDNLRYHSFSNMEHFFQFLNEEFFT